MGKLTKQDKEVLKDIRKEDLEVLNIIAKRFRHKSWLHLTQIWRNKDNFCETDMEKAVISSRQVTEERIINSIDGEQQEELARTRKAKVNLKYCKGWQALERLKNRLQESEK